jgi:hypothetical protein
VVISLLSPKDLNIIYIALMSKRISPSLVRSSKRFSFDSYWMANKLLTSLTFWNSLILYFLFSLIITSLGYSFVHGYIQKHSSSFKLDCLVKKDQIPPLVNSVNIKKLTYWREQFNFYSCFSSGVYTTTLFQLELFKKYHRPLISKLGVISFPDNPEILANYIAYQITTSKQNKTPYFQKGLVFGLYSTAKIFLSTLRLTKNNLVGIRIICRGRWAKTKTGRTKKISLAIGSIHSKKINSVVYHGTASKTTRFGKFMVTVLLDCGIVTF